MGQEECDSDSANHRLAWDMRGLFVGPMPTQAFLDKFLPLNGTEKCPDAGSRFAFFEGNEKANYERFVSMVYVSAPAMPR